MRGITYFRLNSPYEGDITKNNCLTGNDVDNNFNVLEGRDVKSIELVDDEIILNLMNGETIKAEDSFNKECITDISFDKSKGTLKFMRNGQVVELDGFATIDNSGQCDMNFSVSSDNTMVGNGTPSKPLGISPIAKTGQYKPVLEIVDNTNCNCGCGQIPNECNLTPGARYLTEEQISDYGYLYNYNAVMRIACNLKSCNSPWRIPSKDEWDDMLDAIEPCEGDRNHASASSNIYLGRYAGKFLKSKNLWLKEKCHCNDNCCDCGGDNCHCDGNCCDCDKNNSCQHINGGCNDMCDCITYDNDDFSGCIDYTKECRNQYCGEEGQEHHCNCCHENNSGIDSYGFRLTPAGYADDSRNFLNFKERAAFWTATNSKCTKAYVKRFEFDHSDVHQDAIASQNFLSLRLIKDYDGTNYNEREDILGMPFTTVLMPSLKNGRAVWTSMNVNFGNKDYNPVIPNNGNGMTYTKHYYINEWDGKQWNRNELKEGETVVVKNAPDCKKDVLYVVQNNELVDFSKIIYNHVIETVNPKFNNLNEKIENEIKRSTDVDNEISNTIKELKENDDRIEGIANKNTQDIIETNENLNKTNDILKHLSEETAKGFSIVNQAIQDETHARVAEDIKLKNMIDETNTNVSNNTELINKETQDRKNEDEKLNNLIVKANEDINSIEDRIIQKDGNIYDCENGLLTLKCRNEENNIQIKLESNYGTF